MEENFWLQRRTILALALSILALAEIIDLTIVSVALPNIMGALSANLDEITLTITSYIVASAIFIPLTGIVTAKYGVKKVALASALLFGISSILCGISSSVEEMVIFRLLQGIGGAFLPSLAQAFIMTEFKGNDKAKMMTIFSSCIVLGPIIGPIMGGAIAEHLNWRWVFYVNVPICILGFLIIQFLMEDSEPKQIKADYISFFFMLIGVGCLEYFIDEGNQKSWFDSNTLIIVLAIAILFIIFFIWRGLLGKSVVNFKLFKYTNYNLSCLAIWLIMLVIIGTLAFFPTLLQQTYGYQVDTAGYIVAPRGIASFIAAPLFMKLGKRIDQRILMVVGLAIYAISSFMLIGFSPTQSKFQIITSAMLQGAGLMGAFINLMQLAYTNLPAEYNSDAAGVFNFFRNIGNSVGTSIASTIIARQQQVSWHDLGAHVSPYARGYQYWSQSLPQAYSTQIASGLVGGQAFLIGNLDVFYYSLFGLMIIAVIPIFLDKPLRSGEMNVHGEMV